ncbi:MAG: hypothetical protein ACXWKP_29860 [Bradyrhizobium sp.]
MTKNDHLVGLFPRQLAVCVNPQCVFNRSQRRKGRGSDRFTHRLAVKQRENSGDRAYGSSDPGNVSGEPGFVRPRSPPPDVDSRYSGIFVSIVYGGAICDKARGMGSVYSEICNVAISDARIVPPSMYEDDNVIRFASLQMLDERLELTLCLTANRYRPFEHACFFGIALFPQCIWFAVFLEFDETKIVT